MAEHHAHQKSATQEGLMGRSVKTGTDKLHQPCEPDARKVRTPA
jgi:hypothetical protein